jgi:hypothetical protein
MPSKAKKTHPARTKSPARPKMLRISEEMKQWSAMLAAELERWPQVTSRPMFGLLGFYRKTKIFGGLPITRSIGTSNSIIFKIDPLPTKLAQRVANDPRIQLGREPGGKWTIFEVRSEQDLRDALQWLSLAYELAK